MIAVEPALRARSLEETSQIIRYDRLLADPVRAQITRDALDGITLREGRQNDCDRRCLARLDSTEQFESVHARHHQISKQNVRGITLQLFACFCAIQSRFNGVIPR